MNIALIGFGYWGRVWRKVIERNPQITLKFIFHRGASNNGIFTNDLDALLSSNVDAAIVATPSPSHFEIVELLLQNKKHVLCEKPLALSLTEAVSLAELAERHCLVLETNFTYLHSPTIQHMRRQLGALGKLYAIESNIDGFGNFYRNEDVYSVHGPHMLAIVADIFPTAIFSVSTQDLVFSQTGTVDVGIIQLAIGNLTIRIHASLRGIKRERKIVVYGKRGVMEYDGTSEEQFKMTLYTEVEGLLVGRGSFAQAFDESLNMDHALQKFLDCVRGEVLANTQLAIRVTALLEHISSSVQRDHHKRAYDGHS